MKPLILCRTGHEDMASRLAPLLDAEHGEVETRRFPDGETYVRIASPVKGRRIVLVTSLDRPDDKLLPLLFLAAGARDLGAADVGLVAPYLPYMRQDKRFREGEAVTSTCFAQIISRWVDWLVTVDPHLHRRSSLSEIYTIPATSLHAAPLISSWIKTHVSAPVLVGPDSESSQWVAAVARDAGAPHIVLEKTRRGDRDVSIHVPDLGSWIDHTPVLVDDIISSGRTMVETVRGLIAIGMKRPVCIGVHGVFAGNAYRELMESGPQEVMTCNTVPHPSNGIDLSDLIAGGVRHTMNAVQQGH